MLTGKTGDPGGHELGPIVVFFNKSSTVLPKLVHKSGIIEQFGDGSGQSKAVFGWHNNAGIGLFNQSGAFTTPEIDDGLARSEHGKYLRRASPFEHRQV